MVTRLKIARENKGVSAEAVAIAVGVSQAAISRVENAIARPSPKLADRLERYFGRDVITRDQILFPEDYADDAPARKPARHPQIVELYGGPTRT